VVRVFAAELNYRGKAIVFTPRLDENKRVVWRGASDEIPARPPPPECRHQPPPATTSHLAARTPF